jgi:hypothetical protein
METTLRCTYKWKDVGSHKFRESRSTESIQESGRLISILESVRLIYDGSFITSTICKLIQNEKEIQTSVPAFGPFREL